ncbi:MAG: right-handed parallel beta-helix repeat-containing protein, partial [Paludibacteraceae bacterium]|nr:right-handed parallel beta-helix repeat-containing protein [Paludibacteraceae bacterium]
MKRFFSLVVALMAMQLMFAAKIQVTNTSGDPTVEGSLPWACKTGTSSDTIVFKFSTSGKKVINISTALSPTASIDGSTYSDSIIVDGSLDDGEHVSQGLSSTGTFVKNIVVQNFVTGIRTSKNSNIINCVIRNNTADGVLSQMGESFQNCTIINNGDCGIDNQTGGSAGTISSIENCEISGNKLVGIRAGVAVMKKTSILNNHIGLHALNAGDEISDCVISGNDSIGV